MTRLKRRTMTRRRRTGGMGVEPLESRALLATFSVTNFLDAGAGSLRAALHGANANPGPDTIEFAALPTTPGTIRLAKALPAITGPVTIDATTAPAYAGSPVVTLDFAGKAGLRFAPGSDGSALEGLALVRASGAGVTLDASNVTVAGNWIGLRADGTVAGNGGDGVRINSRSSGNVIGNENPVSDIEFYASTNVPDYQVTGWQGLREWKVPGEYLFAGTSNDDGLLYIGPINGSGGKAYTVNFEGAAQTSIYGPANADPAGTASTDRVRLVGTYVNEGEETRYGFIIEGQIIPSGFDVISARTIQPERNGEPAEFTFVHSTMGDLAVGNYDGKAENGAAVGPGRAFLYQVSTRTILGDIQFPGALSNSAYGMWWNGGTSYTICGGFSVDPVPYVDPDRDANLAIGLAYLVDYDLASGRFSNWKAFNYPNGPVEETFVTHFQGISGAEAGVYTLVASSATVGATTAEYGSFVTVRRNTDGSFGDAAWVDVDNTAYGTTLLTSVAGYQVTGLGIDPTSPFQATIETGFQLSNVISGNGGNGITINGSQANVIAMNHIGTNPAGTVALGNRGQGIHVTAGASGNLIGGQATGGNDPTADVFVRPPQGNLVSGNGRNGVLIDGRSTATLLSGNFVGTTVSGNAPLGNALDGVAIVNADGNELQGTTFRQSPFVFYNVLSGNGGNGLRITDSNDTIVQANFLGVGADNTTVVANAGNGMLLSGTSNRIVAGGVIPLGNVVSGNARHGIELRDRVGGLTSFNNFVGLFAFGGAAPNGGNGIQISASGADNVIRTSVVSGNLGNGIVLTGRATGVVIEDTAVGTTTSIGAALPNLGSGIVISGNARDIAIGGFQPSIELRNYFSGNARYGIEILGKARNTRIFATTVGAGFVPTDALPNGAGGIFIGSGTSGTTIGGSQPAQANSIVFNQGNGITIVNSTGNTILGGLVGNNTGFGISITGSRDNRVGSIAAGTAISGNGLGGVYATGDLRGTVLVGNSIQSNLGSGVLLNAATDLVIGGTAFGEANTITANTRYGVAATGRCSRTRVIRNVLGQNALGPVDFAGAQGIVYVP